MTSLGGDLPPVDLVHWLLAVSPVAVLLGLVVWGRWSMPVNGLLALTWALVVGGAGFGAGSWVLAVGLGKGLWVGFWILLVIWSALLLHGVTKRVGLESAGAVLERVLDRPVENVLVVAWVFASLIQGVAGFGVPIAVTAPLLVVMGVRPVLAVALPLVGYHWAVGFGSMGSSFYVGSLTAGLDEEQTGAFAADASLLLGLNSVVAGVLVAFLYGGWRGVLQGWRVLLLCGALMSIVQALVVRVEPAIGSVCGAAAGLLGIGLLRLFRRTRLPSGAGTTGHSEARAGTAEDTSPATVLATVDEARTARPSIVALLPYALLIMLALAVYLPPASRAWVKSHLTFGPSFRPTETSAGFENPAVADYTPVALLGHPAFFLVAASVLSLLLLSVAGRWPRGALPGVARQWLRQSSRASTSVLALTAIAGLMADTGMVRTVAVGAVHGLGDAFPLAAGLIGCVGAFLTGSTTSSNALFASLQADAAQLLGVPPSPLLAAQLAGGNVGNSVAPLTIAIGAASLGDRRLVGAVFRRTVSVAWVLLLLTMLGTVLLVF